MRINRTRIGLVVNLLLLSLASFSAIPIPALDLPALTREANLIVVGEATGVLEAGRETIDVHGQLIPARRMVATLRVDRAVKGQPNAMFISVGFLIPDQFLGYRGIAPNQHGMFFLRATRQPSYVVLDPYYPFIVASRDAPTAKGDDLDRVIGEVAQVLVTPGVSRDEREQVIDVLARVETATATAALQRAARDLDPSLGLRAAAALLRRGDLSTFDKVVDVLLHPPQHMETDLLRRLAFAIQDGVKDPSAIPALTRLLRARDIQTRRGAAAALRHTEVEAAIEPLSMALQDSDREVRYHAVFGLAVITGQYEWAPSADVFERDEQRYLTHWREWVKTR